MNKSGNANNNNANNSRGVAFGFGLTNNNCGLKVTIKRNNPKTKGMYDLCFKHKWLSLHQ